MCWVVNPTPRLLDSWERYALPSLQETGWIQGPVRKGAKKLSPNGIRSPDRPARSESLCQPNYPGLEWKIRKESMDSDICLRWRAKTPKLRFNGHLHEEFLTSCLL